MNQQVTNSPLSWMDDDLAALAGLSRLRHLRETEPGQDGYITVDGRRLLNLCSNDYLGISASLGIPTRGPAGIAGATGSRMIVGNHPDYGRLEGRMAELQQTEAALVFNSGYMANTGVIPAVAGRNDAIFADRLVHASIIDGIRLSGARLFRYRHLDSANLETLLQAHDGFRRRLIITESIFSMDGDLAPLAAIVELKDRYRTMLMVDEAHSAGVRGPEGAGLVRELDLGGGADIWMGTFGKAYGTFGACVCGEKRLIDYLVCHARTHIFATGLPPDVVNNTLRAVEKVCAEDALRDRLRENGARFREGLRAAGMDIGDSESHIIPVIIGEDAAVLEFGEKLEQAGILAVAIRPPTVPEGTARVRFTIMATHSPDDIDLAVAAIAQAKGVEKCG